MIRRVACGLLLIAGAVSCVSALGIDDERESAVTALCQCVSGSGRVFEESAQCQVVLNQKLDSASAGTRAAWLQNFASKGCDRCSKFGGDLGSQKMQCLALAPTCALHGDSCANLPCCQSLTCADGLVQCQ